MQDSIQFPRSAALLLMLFAPWMIGCGGDDGPPRASVQGAVSLDGQPLAEGVIRFIPTGKTAGPAEMAVIHGGEYELSSEQGPILGLHRIEIVATGHHGFAIDDEMAFAKNVEQKGGRMKPNPIPEIYNQRSTLTANIGEREIRDLNFNLSSQGGQTAQR